MTRAIVLAALLVPAIAHADEWQTKARGALKIERHDDLVWPLTAACDKGDDQQQRQCRIVRDRKREALNGATLWMTGDADAVQAAAWNAQKKSVAVTLHGCVTCAGVDVDGKSWVVVGGAGARLDGGKARGGTLYDNAKPFADEAAAAAWRKVLASARFEVLVKIPAKPRIQLGGKDALAVDIVAWRIVNACDGSIVLSSVPSGNGEPDKRECRTPAGSGGATVPNAPAQPEAIPDELSPRMVQNAMRPVVTAARQCASRMKVSGRARLELVINADGSIAKHEQTGDFVGTPMAKCIDDAVRAAVFPRSKKPTTKVGYPIALQ
jgi:hypothetical protein